MEWVKTERIKGSHWPRNLSSSQKNRISDDLNIVVRLNRIFEEIRRGFTWIELLFLRKDFSVPDRFVNKTWSTGKHLTRFSRFHLKIRTMWSSKIRTNIREPRGLLYGTTEGYHHYCRGKYHQELWRGTMSTVDNTPRIIKAVQVRHHKRHLQLDLVKLS